jgi:hypothetical protein
MFELIDTLTGNEILFVVGTFVVLPGLGLLAAWLFGGAARLGAEKDR